MISLKTKLDRAKAPVTGWCFLFGAMYFSQAICEPTEGLIAQPVRSLLKSWDVSGERIGFFSALLALPWAIKPLYGLLSDFVPLRGSRRRNYLLLTTMITGISLGLLFLMPPGRNQIGWLFALLVLPTLGIAFADVVVDALMIQYGQPLNMTGRFQSVQWAAAYSATILAAPLAGWLSSGSRQHYGFLICSMAATTLFVLSYLFVRDPEIAAPLETRMSAKQSILEILRTPAIRWLIGFLLLWNFNPFSSTVLYLHMTEYCGFSETFYGVTISAQSFGAVVASILYGFYCRRVNLSGALYLAILFGILATVAYCMMSGELSLLVISFFVGLTYMTANLFQMDVAAKICKPESAATTFALLMSVTNLSMSGGIAAGGWIYARRSIETNAPNAFLVLVGLGALTTALCALIVPFLIRHVPDYSARSDP